MSANDICSNLTNVIMPSQSLSYDVFDNSHLTTCSEGDNLFQEESGKYDLDTVSVFVAKLYQLLDGDEYKEYLTWNETGDVFVICNMEEFAQNVLPKYFKHCKFTSFVRQLNIYGFYRVSDARKSKHVRSKHACVFSHSQFRRGRQDLLPNIRRKVTKTVRRKPRPSEPSISQNQGETNPISSPPSIYGSPINSKNGNTKDSPSQYMLNSFPESKDFVPNPEKSDSDNVMRKRIAELTETTESLRKELKNTSDIVERLLPEVRSLTEDLHKYRVHVMQLTQLVTSPGDIQLLQDRGYTRNMPSHDLRSAKRVRLDDKQSTSVKTEQSTLSSSAVTNAPTVPSSVANVPTVLSSSVPASYDNVFSSHQDNSIMNSPTDPSVQGAPPVSQPLTMPTDAHPAFNMSESSIIGEFQHSHNIANYNGSWNTTCHLMTDPVNTVTSSFLFPTANSDHSPILYSPSSNQNSSPHSQHEQLSSPASSTAPPGDGTATSADLISNAVATTSSSNDNHHSSGSNTNSPHRRNDVIVAVSPTSTTSSPPMPQHTAPITNYYPPQLEIYNSYSNY